MGDVKKEMSKHDIRIRMGIVDIHHDQGIVEHFNRTLSECLFSYQYNKEKGMGEEASRSSESSEQ